MTKTNGCERRGWIAGNRDGSIPVAFHRWHACQRFVKENQCNFICILFGFKCIQFSSSVFRMHNHPDRLAEVLMTGIFDGSGVHPHIEGDVKIFLGHTMSGCHDHIRSDQSPSTPPVINENRPNGGVNMCEVWISRSIGDRRASSDQASVLGCGGVSRWGAQDELDTEEEDKKKMRRSSLSCWFVGFEDIAVRVCVATRFSTPKLAFLVQREGGKSMSSKFIVFCELIYLDM